MKDSFQSAIHTRAAAIIRVTVILAAVEAVVMGRVTDHVIALTVGSLVTHINLTETIIADLPGLAV